MSIDAREQQLVSKVKAASGLLVAVGLLHLATGIAALSGVQPLLDLGMDGTFVALGAGYVAAGWKTRSQHRWALIAGTVLFASHTALVASQLVNGTVTTPISGVLLRMAMLIPLLDAVGASNALERLRRGLPVTERS